MQNRVTIAIVIFTIFCGLIYLVRSVLSPFIFSLIIAYLLNPLVEHLVSKNKISRITASSLILGLFLSVFISICAVLLPIIYIQTTELIDELPKYLQIIAHDFYPRIIAAFKPFGIELDSDLSHLIIQDKPRLVNFSQNFLGSALTSSLTLINVISLIFITPILIFYLLKDWDILTKKTYSFLPEYISHPVKEVAHEIHKILGGYVRGQFNVCLILTIFYSISLSFVGLNFGFLIGFLTGIFAFIPYIGMLCGTTVAFILALFQWGFDFTNLSFVALIFIFAQIIESNFLTPKLIGDRIGVHPVWMIFGLFVFGILFGFIGVLFAVPLTAVCGVIARYFAKKYKNKLGKVEV